MFITQLLTGESRGSNIPETPGGAAYLGARVQSDVARLTPDIEEQLRNKVKRGQADKKNMIFKRLGTRNYEHPSFDTINTSDEASIHRFLAMENIKCALICDPFKSLEEVSILCDIINSEYDSSKLHPHVSIFRGYEEAKNQGDSPEDLITYFKVNLKGAVQDTNEKACVIKELTCILG